MVIYYLENIRTLLTEGFSDEELRYLCFDMPDFRPIYDQLAANSGKAKIIACLIEYADRKLLLDPLLTWAKKHNTTRYEKHQPYFGVTDPITSGDTAGKSERDRASPKSTEDTVPLDPPKKRVWIYVSGDTPPLSTERQTMAIKTFALLMGISPEEIEVKYVYKNSIVYDFNVPPDAVQRLHSLLQAGDAKLHLLNIEKIIMENELDEIEEWVIEQGKFALVVPPRLIEFLDEILVALYLRQKKTSEVKGQIQDELRRRYYPHHDPQQRDRPLQGDRFKRRVYGTLLANKVGPEQAEVIWGRCADGIFGELFYKQNKFEKLLRDFDLTRAPPRDPFQHWVLNVRVPHLVVDWLRKSELRPFPEPLPDNLPAEQTPLDNEFSESEFQEGGPWLWWDALLPPKYGLIIRLLHLAYLDPNAYYLEQIAQVSGKTKREVQLGLNLLQQRLCPTRRFGDNEQIQIYALNKMLEAEAFRSLTAETELDETMLEAIVSYAAGRTHWKYSDRPPIEEETVKTMLLEAFVGEPIRVAEVKQVLSRWIDFLEGELIEGQLVAVQEEIVRREEIIKRHKEYLHNFGLDDHALAELSDSATEFSLQELKMRQEAAAKARDERTEQSLVYQEQVLRLNKVRRKRDKLLADHNSGKYLVTPLQRELADILGLTIGAIGVRVAQAKRALSGAMIWREVLNGVTDLEMATEQRRSWLDQLERTCVISLEQKILRIGIPGVTEPAWWNELRPDVGTMLQRPSLRTTLSRFEQMDITIDVINYKGDWPPLRPVWDDEASGWIWRLRQ